MENASGKCFAQSTLSSSDNGLQMQVWMAWLGGKGERAVERENERDG